MLCFIKKQLQASQSYIIWQDIPLPTTLRAGTTRKIKMEKSVEETGAEKGAQNVPGYQILSSERNPAKRNTPMSPERSQL